MRIPAQLIGLFLAVTFSFVWLMSPSLKPYSLQLAAALFLAYMVSKRIARAHILHLAPSATIQEFATFTTMLLVLVGYTGGLSSIFFPLLYLLLFVGVLTMDISTIIALGLLLPLFLWSTHIGMITQREIAAIASFPILLPLLVFSRYQYVQAQEERKDLAAQSELQQEAALFLSTFLKPKLVKLLEMSEYPDHNKEVLQKQITLIIEETDTVSKDGT
ncbi:MAG TPA: hypothetical protein VJ246_01025 [Patescibacteria group bacterium]|nr:hypothetical protein [Patescibacteria group bacterium]